jgi:fused signal recognition particle receptor
MTTWWSRLTSGLKRSSAQVGTKLRSLFVNRRIDADLLDEIEELLIQSDMGVSTAAQMRGHLEALKLPPSTTADEVLEHLAEFMALRLQTVEHPFTFTTGLNVVLMVGVNGSGKTTTISKLARQWMDKGLKVELAACDTFRAAATEQLAVWADRLGVPLYQTQTGHDASGLAYDAVQEAQKSGADVLIIDTAGRLQNKEHLMKELEKIQRVIKKVIPEAPHHALLILDATTGQNALAQVKAFQEQVNVTGLIITKLDGTAKGGVLVALADTYNIPIYALGVGESFDDLQPFSAKHFARALVGLSEDSV